MVVVEYRLRKGIAETEGYLILSVGSTDAQYLQRLVSNRFMKSDECYGIKDAFGYEACPLRGKILPCGGFYHGPFAFFAETDTCAVRSPCPIMQSPAKPRSLSESLFVTGTEKPVALTWGAICGKKPGGAIGKLRPSDRGKTHTGAVIIWHLKTFLGCG